MRINEEQLKEFVLDSGVISKTNFESALKKADKENLSIGEVLVDEGRISEDELRRIHAHILGIPFVDLTGEKIDF